MGPNPNFDNYVLFILFISLIVIAVLSSLIALMGRKRQIGFWKSFLATLVASVLSLVLLGLLGNIMGDFITVVFLLLGPAIGLGVTLRSKRTVHIQDEAKDKN